jgi:hypothetical protein
MNERSKAYDREQLEKMKKPVRSLWSPEIAQELRRLARISEDYSQIVARRLCEIAEAKKGDPDANFSRFPRDAIPFSDGSLQAQKWGRVYDVLVYAALNHAISNGASEQRLADLLNLSTRRPSGHDVVRGGGWLMYILRTIIQPQMARKDKTLINQINQECLEQLGPLDTVEEEIPASEDVDDIPTVAGLSISDASPDVRLDYTPPGSVRDPLPTPKSPSTVSTSRRVYRPAVDDREDDDSGLGSSLPSSRMNSIPRSRGSKASRALTNLTGPTSGGSPIRSGVTRLPNREGSRWARLYPSTRSSHRHEVVRTKVPSLGPFSPSRKTSELSMRRPYTRWDPSRELYSLRPTRTAGSSYTSDPSAATVATELTRNSGAPSRPKFSRIIYGGKRGRR